MDDKKSIYEAGTELMTALQQLLHDSHALSNIRQKLPQVAIREFQEIQANNAHINKVRPRGKGWNHHK